MSPSGSSARVLASADELAARVPDDRALTAIRGPVAHRIGEAYPRFAEQVFPYAA